MIKLLLFVPLIFLPAQLENQSKCLFSRTHTLLSLRGCQWVKEWLTYTHTHCSWQGYVRTVSDFIQLAVMSEAYPQARMFLSFVTVPYPSSPIGLVPSDPLLNVTGGVFTPLHSATCQTPSEFWSGGASSAVASAKKPQQSSRTGARPTHPSPKN